MSGVTRAAAAGALSNWPGAALLRSDDGGGSYGQITALGAEAAMGAALTALSAGVLGVFDEVASVEVALIGEGALASAEELAVFNGANAALLGDEIIQFRDATLLSPGKYRLSGLLRGRQGTEWAMESHAAGERFVLLSGAVISLNASISQIGLPRLYKPVTIGASVADTPATTYTYTGVGYKPYAPCQMEGVRDASGNLTVTWLRRARGSAEWLDYVDAPLNETAESYDVEVMDGEVVVRSYSALAAPEIVYSAAEQVADFGAVQSSVALRIYQRSSVVGRGYAAEVVV